MSPLPTPAVILAADHRARGVITVESYRSYLDALSAVLPVCDGILASMQPLRDLVSSGALGPHQRTYLSLNRTGLAGSAFELDDRVVTTVGRAVAEGCTGIKHMTRIDLTDPLTAPALELLGKVLDEARAAGLDALVESLSWRAGHMARDTDSIVYAAVVAHDLGAPVLKVPVPDVAPGAARIDAVARIVASVGVPVLFLGGPRRTADTESESRARPDPRDDVLDEIRDAMAGGAAGLAIGRVVFQDPDPATMARLVAEAVPLSPRVILTIDLGTSVTKVVVWTDTGPLAVGRSPLRCTYSPGNRVEQDPGSWWPSVVDACAAAGAAARQRPGVTGADGADVFGAVRAVGFCAARQSFVPVTADGTTLGPALLWSDRRASVEAAALAVSLGADAIRRRTGVVLDAGSVAAKVAWMARHEPDRLAAARWLLSPRDLLAWHLTGEVSTDVTLASATGLYTLSGAGSNAALGPLVPGLVDAAADLLPQARPSDTVTGPLRSGPAAELGLPAGIPVVIGAGDRACEVLGAGASATWPMVSWGTTANVSVPVLDDDLVEPVPTAMIVTRGAMGGWLLEGGLSAAGSLVDWLARLTGLDTDALMDRARSSPPGSGGVVALPWLGGARAPWWRDTARGAVLGLSFDHDAGDVARAMVESVAFDVARCLESAAASSSSSSTVVGLVLGGGGAHVTLWTDILTAVTGLPARRRRSGEAASAGAALLVARATGTELDLDRLDPVDAEIAPGISAVAAYAALRPTVDAAAAAVVALEPGR